MFLYLRGLKFPIVENQEFVLTVHFLYSALPVPYLCVNCHLVVEKILLSFRPQKMK